MFLGLSRAEIGLVVFVVALVYGASWVPRFTEMIAIMIAKRGSKGSRGP